MLTIKNTSPVIDDGTHTPNSVKSYFCTMPENTRLHELLAENEQAFIEALFKAYFPMVCKTIYRLVQDAPVAEDLAQELFIKIWNKRNSLQDIYFKAYLHKSAINMALDYLDKTRRKGQHTPLDETMVLVQSAHSGQNIQQTKIHIQEAINRLPEKCREIFILSRYEEMSYREIADTLNISVKTVENQVITALKKLRVSLQEYLQAYLLVIATPLYPLFLNF
ncbi:RNA polymerase sigma factor [Chitinophaga defluvii]|uniref:RNA polymerase sigma-70 factor n=1 Tax=Chitinophaga defluvii TaxID=3163343 RepID=A0ABV2T6J2_9BACT